MADNKTRDGPRDAHPPKLVNTDATSDPLSIAFNEILRGTGSYDLLLAGLVDALEDDA
jgi:hypothetical protein